MTTSLFQSMKNENNKTHTTNDMGAYKSTLNSVLDLFVKGASYRSNPSDIISLVEKAYNEDKNLALKCLFYLRDVRGNIGQGEREIFRKAIRRIAELDTDNFIKSDIISLIPIYGRWDDIFSLFDVSEFLNIEILKVLSNQLDKDIKAIKSSPDAEISILAKWLPSCNTSSEKSRQLAKRIYKSFGVSEQVYRKTLAVLRKRIGIIERNLSEKDYTFDYSSIPSNANLKYRACFVRNDNERYQKHIEDVANALLNNDKNGAKDNVRTLYPYEIVSKIIFEPYMSNLDKTRYNNLWMQLPNYFGEKSINKNWLTVIDTSGSMTCTCGNVRPIDVAISLGLYIGERNTGIFKDKYITFSEEPQLIEFGNIKSIYDRVQFIYNNSIISNTNIEAVFDLILRSAVANGIPAEEMPEGVFIISDMQFDAAIDDSQNESIYELVQKKYEIMGYKAPKLIFWNVAQIDYDNLPVKKNDTGAILVNGCKPGMFEMILSGCTPEEFMINVLNDERYSKIRFVE